MIFHSKTRRTRTNDLKCPSCTAAEAKARSAGLSAVDRVSLALELLLLACQLEDTLDTRRKNTQESVLECRQVIERLKQTSLRLAPS